MVSCPQRQGQCLSESQGRSDHCAQAAQARLGAGDSEKIPEFMLARQHKFLSVRSWWQLPRRDCKGERPGFC
jgi:hypothetical protein